jgi:hypothetical protein
MQITKFDSTIERQILIGMITNRSVLGMVSSKWKYGMFPSKWSNTIAQLCIKYYSKYQKAPGKEIQYFFEQWSATGNKDQKLVESMDTFLSSLSNQYQTLKKKLNPQLVIDEAGKFFTKIKLQEMTSQINAHLENGEIDEAEELRAKFSKVEMGLGSHIDVLEDKEALKRAFELDKEPPLITYEGAAGNFFKDTFKRGGLICLEGREKIGKSFWLQEFAWQALKQKRRVAFFGCGDMTEEETMLRFIPRICGRPLDTESYQYPILLEPPDGDGTIARVTHETKKWKEPLTIEEASRMIDKFREKIKADKMLRLSSHATKTISASGIKAKIEEWKTQNWIPDVLIIDYSDILAPIYGNEMTRDQIDLSWSMLRQMSQVFRCLTITATQIAARGYEAEMIDITHYSEDKRKRAHLTASITLNQNPDEEENEIYRLGMLMRRSRKAHKKKCLHTAACLAIASPMIHHVF